MNSSTTNIAGINYQPQLRASVTVTGAFLASLGGCSIRGMSLGLNISILESRSQGTMCVADILSIIMELIVYLYFDVYKSCIPITSITSEIGT